MSIDCSGHGVCHNTESTPNNTAAAVHRVVSKGSTGKGQSLTHLTSEHTSSERQVNLGLDDSQSKSGPKKANVVYTAIKLKANLGYMTEFKTRMGLG